MSQTIPQILDVTLRDGGYVNDWQFLLPNALAIVSTLAKGGMPYIEVGYYHPPHPSTNGSGHHSGPSAYCQHEYLEAMSRVRGNSKLCVMVHLNEVLPTDYTFLADHDISTLRFVVPGSNIQQLEPHMFEHSTTRAAHRRSARSRPDRFRQSHQGQPALGREHTSLRKSGSGSGS